MSKILKTLKKEYVYVKDILKKIRKNNKKRRFLIDKNINEDFMIFEANEHPNEFLKTDSNMMAAFIRTNKRTGPKLLNRK